MKTTRNLVTPLVVMPVILIGTLAGSLYLNFERNRSVATVTEKTYAVRVQVERALDIQVSSLQLLADALPLDATKSEQVQILGRFKSRYPHWRNIRIFSPDGDLRIDFPEQHGSFTMVGADSFELAIRTKKAVIGRLEIGPLGRLAFPIRVPVLRNGAVSQVISAAIDPAILNEAIHKVDFPSDWGVVVVDSYSAIVARYPNPEKYLGKPPSEGTANSRISHKVPGVYHTHSLEGRDLISGITWLDNYPGWSAHVGKPEQAQLRVFLDRSKEFAQASALGFVGYLWLLIFYIKHTMENRKAADERQTLLTNEVLHRTKNMYSVVQSLITRSLKGHRPLAAEKQALLERLSVLSRTDSHFLSVSSHKVRLDSLIAETISLFTDNYRLRADEVMVSGTMSQSFALLVHELATNSVKYGALSAAEGYIEIDLHRSGGGEFRFAWKDCNGPVCKEPARRGFGLSLLDMLARGMGAKSSCEFDATGFRCWLSIKE